MNDYAQPLTWVYPPTLENVNKDDPPRFWENNGGQALKPSEQGCQRMSTKNTIFIIRAFFQKLRQDGA